MSHDDLVRRAYAAIYRSGADLPGVMTGRVAETSGRQYVVLSDGNAILAVYRVRNDGMLKGLKRWPRALEEQIADPCPVCGAAAGQRCIRLVRDEATHAVSRAPSGVRRPSAAHTHGARLEQS